MSDKVIEISEEAVRSLEKAAAAHCIEMTRFIIRPSVIAEIEALAVERCAKELLHKCAIGQSELEDMKDWADSIRKDVSDE